MTTNGNWNIIGHSWAVNLLKNQLVNLRMRHAYLITGPDGIGRRTLALRLAQAINCKQSTNPGLPCRECRTCLLIEKCEHPDLSTIQAEQVGGTIKVDQIRELQHSLSLTPFEAKFRIALLLRFEEANLSSANALLKTLEEPQPQVVMLLTAQDTENLLPTIVSRCEVIRLRTLSLDTIIQGLQAQYGTPAEQAKLFAHISGGRPGYAIKLQVDPSIMERRLTWLDELVKLISSSRTDRFEYVDMIAKEKSNLENLLQIWGSFWRDVYLTISGASSNITNLDWKTEINFLSEEISFSKSVEMVNHLQNTSNIIKRNVNPRLILEVLMLDLPFIRKSSMVLAQSKTTFEVQEKTAYKNLDEGNL